MIFLKGLFVVIVVICCLLLIGLILLQRSKSEGLGLAFGASTGESLFGARAGNVLSKATVVLGITFLASTLILGKLFVQKEKPIIDILDAQPAANQPSAVQSQPIDPMTPVFDDFDPLAVPEADLPAESPDETM